MGLTLWWTATGLQSELKDRTGLEIAVFNNNMDVELPKVLGIRVMRQAAHRTDNGPGSKVHKPVHPGSADEGVNLVADELLALEFTPHGTTGAWWQPGVKAKDTVGGGE